MITPADPVAALQDALGARTTTFVAKVDTAGLYFVMIIPIAFGAAAVRSRWSFGWLAAGLTITAALWLTGTRAAIIAGLAVAVATVSWVTLRRYFSANRWQIGIMLAIITALLLLTYEAFQFRAESIRLALSIRLWLAETTLGMLASRPLLGFGIGQYRPWSCQFSPPELLAIYPSADAHNYFFQIAGELGAIGLVLFLWLLGAAVLAAWRALRVARADSRLAGTLAGICAFLLSCLGDHALLFAPVAYPFWMVLGLAVGLADQSLVRSGVSKPSEHPAFQSRPNPLRPGALHTGGFSGKALPMIAIVALIGSIPARVTQEVKRINLARVDYGFSNWHTEGTGLRYRWTAGRATFFVLSDERAVEIPLRAPLTNSNSLQPILFEDGYEDNLRFALEVEIALDGRVADRVRLANNTWRRVRLQLPPVRQRRFRRVDKHRQLPTFGCGHGHRLFDEHISPG